MTTATTFSCDDMEDLTSVVADAWLSAERADWSVPAGTLEWTCAKTADHAIDTVLAPAVFLASRKQDAYPDGGWSPGEAASPTQLVDGLWIATRILTAVVAAADPDVRAIIWRRPQRETRPPRDFVPRAALELILHSHDVCSGLGVPFDPPPELCDRLRRHTEHWPFWAGGSWSPLTMDGDPWADLLRASGRFVS